MKRSSDDKNMLRFCTTEGRAFTLAASWRKAKVEKVLEEIRREKARGAGHLVVDGKVVGEGETLEGAGEGEVFVVLKTPLRQAEPYRPPAGMKLLEEGLKGGVPDLSSFVKWLVLDDFCIVLDDLLREREGSDEEDVDYEELLDSQHPLQEVKVAAIMNMGFPKAVSKKALWLNNMDVERSLNYLLEVQPSQGPVSRADFKKVKQHMSNALRSPLSHHDTAMGFLTELRRSSISWMVEDALAATDTPPQLLREAFGTLLQHPHAIHDYMTHPELAPFFVHIHGSHTRNIEV